MGPGSQEQAWEKERGQGPSGVQKEHCTGLQWAERARCRGAVGGEHCSGLQWVEGAPRRAAAGAERKPGRGAAGQGGAERALPRAAVGGESTVHGKGVAERALSVTEGPRGRQTLGKTREHSTVGGFSHHPREMNLGLACWLAGRLKER